MTLADVLDGSFRLLVEHWRTYVVALGVVLIPLTLLTSVVLAGTAPDLLLPDLDTLTDPSAPVPTIGVAGAVGIATAVAINLLVTFPLTLAVCAVVASDVVAGAPREAGETLRTAVRRTPAMLGLGLLATVAVVLAMLAVFAAVAFGALVAGAAGDALGVGLGVVGALVLAAAGVWLATRLSLSVAVVAAERAGPLRALRRAWVLTRTRFWPLLGAVLLVQVIATVVGGIIAIPTQVLAVAFANRPFIGVSLLTFGSVVSSLITTPIPVNALVLLYTDRRVRREGADLLSP